MDYIKIYFFGNEISFYNILLLYRNLPLHRKYYKSVYLKLINSTSGSI